MMAELTAIDHDSQTNRRIRKRHQLFFNLAIVDTVSEEEVGKIVNISSQGLMLTASKNLTQEKYSKLTFKMPEKLQVSNNVVFDAEVRWHKPDANPKYELTGFQVISPLAEFKKMSQDLVRKFSFDQAWG